MPRENSFSDSDGRSLTPDLEEVNESVSPISPVSPTYSIPRNQLVPEPSLSSPKDSADSAAKSSTSLHRNAAPKATKTAMSFPITRPELAPTERFRSTVRKVMAMRRSTTMLLNSSVGAEPGVDPRRATAGEIPPSF